MPWTEIVRRRHAEANRALASAVNRSSISVPVQSSPSTAPGWLHHGNFFSCVPDSLYPWDPAVLASIRSLICPDAMPITIRSVWSWVNYNEQGHRADRFLVLTHHGMARAVRDIDPAVAHRFPCPLPVHFPPGLRIPGRLESECQPNQVWDIWQEKSVRPWGPDLPGLYLPFDWDYFRALRRGEDHRVRMLRESTQAEDADGHIVAKGAAAKDVAALQRGHAEEAAQRADQESYVTRDIERYHSQEASDLEWRDKILSDAPRTGNTLTPPVRPSKGEAA